MVSNIEIKLGLECKKEGLGPDETLKKNSSTLRMDR
jgi:hypothetical protein